MIASAAASPRDAATPIRYGQGQAAMRCATSAMLPPVEAADATMPARQGVASARCLSAAMRERRVVAVIRFAALR